MSPAVPILVVACALALAGLVAWTALRRRAARRRDAVRALLDAADGLEARLRQAREEIEAIAGPGQDPVRDALQEMLRQRLWLQQHGANASLEDIAAVRGSIEAARDRVDHQLLRIERARASLH